MEFNKQYKLHEVCNIFKYKNAFILDNKHKLHYSNKHKFIILVKPEFKKFSKYIYKTISNELTKKLSDIIIIISPNLFIDSSKTNDMLGDYFEISDKPNKKSIHLNMYIDNLSVPIYLLPNKYVSSYYKKFVTYYITLNKDNINFDYYEFIKFEIPKLSDNDLRLFSKLVIL